MPRPKLDEPCRCCGRLVKIRAWEMGQRCYDRLKGALSRHARGLGPTRAQAKTLRGMGRPPAALAARHPAVVEMVRAARREG